MAGSTWADFSRVAVGCKDEYIKTTSTTIFGGGRYRQGGGELLKRPALEGDSVVLLQRGLSVIWVSSFSQEFQHRTLKVDDQLNYLYILPRPGGEDPVTFHISTVCGLYTGKEAITVCEKSDIRDTYLTEETCTVLQTADPDNTCPPFHQVLIFMSAPQQQLRKHFEEMFELAGRKVKGHVVHNVQEAEEDAARGEEDPSSWVDCIRPTGIKPMFTEICDQLEVSIFFQGVDTETKFQWTSTCPVSHCDVLARQAADEHNLKPIDAARLNFVLKDTQGLRYWVTNHIPPKFEYQFLQFLTSVEVLKGMVRVDEDFKFSKDIVEEVSVRNGIGFPDGMNPTDFYAESSARASHIALTQLLHLEEEYTKVVAQAVIAKALIENEIPPGVSLSGVLLKAEEQSTLVEEVSQAKANCASEQEVPPEPTTSTEQQVEPAEGAAPEKAQPTQPAGAGPPSTETVADPPTASPATPAVPIEEPLCAPDAPELGSARDGAQNVRLLKGDAPRNANACGTQMQQTACLLQ
eukprot:gnl/TRDRNA2_/TRDRNA2_190294_c0_seq1.p1 gnl/TRDRNA2_/TRDRNA2_190294_c0~~gnl/TRDRNA2_/TRDRNA2_190294_c0_seq1.p1  ORF type:complete len:521 (+),score=105.00 gnl/TRDRNA2_/TRDRNA2_190294_c0_seq1:146-1708(+)